MTAARRRRKLTQRALQGAPLRAIVEVLETGPPVRRERLECGHVRELVVAWNAATDARRRRCYECAGIPGAGGQGS